MKQKKSHSVFVFRVITVKVYDPFNNFPRKVPVSLSRTGEDFNFSGTLTCCVQFCDPIYVLS